MKKLIIKVITSKTMKILSILLDVQGTTDSLGKIIGGVIGIIIIKYLVNRKKKD